MPLAASVRKNAWKGRTNGRFVVESECFIGLGWGDLGWGDLGGVESYVRYATPIGEPRSQKTGESVFMMVL